MAYFQANGSHLMLNFLEFRADSLLWDLIYGEYKKRSLARIS